MNILKLKIRNLNKCKKLNSKYYKLIIINYIFKKNNKIGTNLYDMYQ